MVILELAVALGLIYTFYRIVMRLIDIWQLRLRQKTITGLAKQRLWFKAASSNDPEFIDDVLHLDSKIPKGVKEQLEQRWADIVIDTSEGSWYNLEKVCKLKD